MIVYESIHFLYSVLHALFVFPLPQQQKQSKTQSPKYWSIVAAPPVKLEQAPVKFSEQLSPQRGYINYSRKQNHLLSEGNKVKWSWVVLRTGNAVQVCLLSHFCACESLARDAVMT